MHAPSFNTDIIIIIMKAAGRVVGLLINLSLFRTLSLSLSLLVAVEYNGWTVNIKLEKVGRVEVILYD